MKKAGLLVFLFLAGSAIAAESRTITLGVEHMTCATCPITVRKALSQVPGVAESTVDMKAHTATVTFDPTKTTPEVLATAVTRAGFPAKVVHNGG
jgi:periplasmic mercuric ion binding protein